MKQHLIYLLLLLGSVNLLAQSKAICADHPLKTGAQAVAETFAKVTSCSVQDAEIALPEISRRSPLAPWKMLIRALACFYQQNDEKCRKYLQAVDPASAPGRLVSPSPTPPAPFGWTSLKAPQSSTTRATSPRSPMCWPPSRRERPSRSKEMARGRPTVPSLPPRRRSRPTTKPPLPGREAGWPSGKSKGHPLSRQEVDS